MRIITLLLASLLVVSCSHVTSNSPGTTDRQAIETVSGRITDMRIDSISMTDNRPAIVSYERDSIDAYHSVGAYLYVFNVRSLDTSSPLSSHTPVRCGNWVSDSSYLEKFMIVNMYSDSIPFSGIVYDSISIDSLRMFLRYLRDSTVCYFSGCLRVPLDSINDISLYHDQDTVLVEMSQPNGNYYGLSYGFKWFGDTIKLSSVSRWME